jgi:predicted Co/Zn/Cd cation transporter (cation efflux family)
MASEEHGSYVTSEIAVTIITLAISTLFLILRVVSRALIARRIAADDWLIAFAWLLSTGISALLLYAAAIGFGKHVNLISATDNRQILRCIYVFGIIYVSTLL